MARTAPIQGVAVVYMQEVSRKATFWEGGPLPGHQVGMDSID